MGRAQQPADDGARFVRQWQEAWMNRRPVQTPNERSAKVSSKAPRAVTLFERNLGTTKHEGVKVELAECVVEVNGRGELETDRKPGRQRGRRCEELRPRKMPSSRSAHRNRKRQNDDYGGCGSAPGFGVGGHQPVGIGEVQLVDPSRRPDDGGLGERHDDARRNPSDRPNPGTTYRLRPAASGHAADPSPCDARLAGKVLGSACVSTRAASQWTWGSPPRVVTSNSIRSGAVNVYRASM
jgi:hypothetical protein